MLISVEMGRVSCVQEMYRVGRVKNMAKVHGLPGEVGHAGLARRVQGEEDALQRWPIKKRLHFFMTQDHRPYPWDFCVIHAKVVH